MTRPSSLHLVDLDGDEALRILIAVEERRLYRKKGRFQIDGEEPPNRRTREALRDRGLIVTVYGNDGYRLTPTGKGELGAELAYRRVVRRGN